MPRVMIREVDSYWMVPEPGYQEEWRSDPVGEVDEATLARWQATIAAWEGVQAELISLYRAWSNKEREHTQSHPEGSTT